MKIAYQKIICKLWLQDVNSIPKKPLLTLCPTNHINSTICSQKGTITAV